LNDLSSLLTFRASHGKVHSTPFFVSAAFSSLTEVLCKSYDESDQIPNLNRSGIHRSIRIGPFSSSFPEKYASPDILVETLQQGNDFADFKNDQSLKEVITSFEMIIFRNDMFKNPQIQSALEGLSDWLDLK
jgi:hypothetical protein